MHTSDAATTLNACLTSSRRRNRRRSAPAWRNRCAAWSASACFPGTDGGLVTACEIMISNLAIQALIRDGKDHRPAQHDGDRRQGGHVHHGKRGARALPAKEDHEGDRPLINVTTKNVRAKIESPSAPAPLAAGKS
ncbi:MAG: hypothetical protein WDM96_02390 [Lacunisphaera sp.]